MEQIHAAMAELPDSEALQIDVVFNKIKAANVWPLARAIPIPGYKRMQDLRRISGEDEETKPGREFKGIKTPKRGYEFVPPETAIESYTQLSVIAEPASEDGISKGVDASIAPTLACENLGKTIPVVQVRKETESANRQARELQRLSTALVGTAKLVETDMRTGARSMYS